MVLLLPLTHATKSVYVVTFTRITFTIDKEVSKSTTVMKPAVVKATAPSHGGRRTRGAAHEAFLIPSYEQIRFEKESRSERSCLGCRRFSRQKGATAGQTQEKPRVADQRHWELTQDRQCNPARSKRNAGLK